MIQSVVHVSLALLLPALTLCGYCGVGHFPFSKNDGHSDAYHHEHVVAGFDVCYRVANRGQFERMANNGTGEEYRNYAKTSNNFTCYELRNLKNFHLPESMLYGIAAEDANICFCQANMREDNPCNNMYRFPHNRQEKFSNTEPELAAIRSTVAAEQPTEQPQLLAGVGEAVGDNAADEADEQSASFGNATHLPVVTSVAPPGTVEPSVLPDQIQDRNQTENETEQSGVTQTVQPTTDQAVTAARGSYTAEPGALNITKSQTGQTGISTASPVPTAEGNELTSTVNTEIIDHLLGNVTNSTQQVATSPRPSEATGTKTGNESGTTPSGELESTAVTEPVVELPENTTAAASEATTRHSQTGATVGQTEVSGVTQSGVTQSVEFSSTADPENIVDLLVNATTVVTGATGGQNQSEATTEQSTWARTRPETSLNQTEATTAAEAKVETSTDASGATTRQDVATEDNSTAAAAVQPNSTVAASLQRKAAEIVDRVNGEIQEEIDSFFDHAKNLPDGAKKPVPPAATGDVVGDFIRKMVRRIKSNFHAIGSRGVEGAAYT